MQKKILIIDDEKLICEVLQRLLRSRGFAAEYVNQPEEAAAAFSRICPDLVLLDVSMPGKNGVEVLRTLRALDAGFKAIMVTAMKDEKIFWECRDLGIVDYITKPFGMEQIEARVFGKLLT